MENLQEITADVVGEWLNGSLTQQHSLQVCEDIRHLINDAEKESQSYWKYLKFAEAGDIWRDLIRNGLLIDMTPYAKGKVLYLTLQLLEGQQISLELAYKIIVHASN